jgi:hypothetical protein
MPETSTENQAQASKFPFFPGNRGPERIRTLYFTGFSPPRAVADQTARPCQRGSNPIRKSPVADTTSTMKPAPAYASALWIAWPKSANARRISRDPSLILSITVGLVDRVSFCMFAILMNIRQPRELRLHPTPSVPFQDRFDYACEQEIKRSSAPKASGA